jgi:UDP-N-acetylmuramyl pentapeptide phosphotransferase/UDP-N-acetylglucosamine-1-phosphate transferase
MVCGTSTGVNLTDGLDGLAAGASIPALGAYVIIGIWEFRNDCTVLLMNNCYTVRDPLDIAVVASSVMGACWGFLWWNAPPAKIFMGDTGSHQQIPASRSPQTHSDGSDIRLHHYCRPDGRRVGAVVRAQ